MVLKIKSLEVMMRVKMAVTLVAFSTFVSASAPAVAKHEADSKLLWVQTPDVRSPKTRRMETEHWGKHHHHGIFLEGSDYERSPTARYD
jgi:hypothetical protein